MAHSPLLLASIDDYLGPAENRFFGRGYRRAEHDVSDVVTTPTGNDAGTRASVTIRYPADWSRKKDADLLPHLSTVDMVVLGVQLAEVHLVNAFGLDPAARRATWLRKIVVKAGSTPQEDLEGLVGTARLRSSKPYDDALFDDTVVTVYDTAIGAMQARCEFVHPHGAADAEAGPRSYATLVDALGPAAQRYYGAGFTVNQHHVTNVEVDTANLRATATLRIEPVGEPVPAAEGVEGGYQPAITMVDCFVTNLQLAQVLMYQLDAVPRKDSNTLWMLRTILTAASPHRSYTGGPLSTEAAITNSQLVPLRGGMWRNVEINAACGGVALRASFAHELPADVLTTLG